MLVSDGKGAYTIARLRELARASWHCRRAAIADAIPGGFPEFPRITLESVASGGHLNCESEAGIGNKNWVFLAILDSHTRPIVNARSIGFP